MSRRLMRDFGSIVSVLVGVVDDGGHDLAVSGAVAFQLVGDQPPGRASLPLQQLAEESFGCRSDIYNGVNNLQAHYRWYVTDCF